MARLLPIALVVALLVGTAAAFAVTERLKLVRSPIAAPEIDRVFSPVCDCERDEAAIAFRLREADRVDLAIVDGDGDVVRTLVRSRSAPVGRLEASWDGRDDAGNVVPEGAYRPRVHLRTAAPDDRAPEPDRGRRHGARRRAGLGRPDGLLAGRRRPFRQGHACATG